MKSNFLALGLFGLAGASAVLPRDGYQPAPASYQPAPAGYPTKPQKSYPVKPTDNYATSPQYADENDYEGGYNYKNSQGTQSSWKPKSKDPEFFNLRVDEKCNVVNGVTEAAADCPFNGYAIRLEGGMFIATPYNKWFDPKLPTFFVDDDTQLYTVSVLLPRPRSSTDQMCRSARTLSRSTLTVSLALSSTPRSDGFHPTPLLSASTTLVTTLLVLSTPAPPTSAGPAPRAAASSAALGFSALSAAPSSTRSSSTARTSVSAV
jgi:hypothetical protein